VAQWNGLQEIELLLARREEPAMGKTAVSSSASMMTTTGSSPKTS
jgi:hypothetical protein